MFRPGLFGLGAAGLILSTGIILAQDRPPEVPRAAPEHEFLKHFVGTWACENEVYLEADRPVKSKGSMKGYMIGDFWAVVSVTGEDTGQPYHGQGLFGFDARRKKYIGTWADSMSPFLWRYEGFVDGNTLVLHSEGPDPTQPTRMIKARDSWEFRGKDVIVLTGEMQGPDGNMTTVMKATCTRTPTASPRRERTPAAEEAPPQDGPIDFDRARRLLRKKRSGEELSADEEAYVTRALEARRRLQAGRAGRARDERTLGPGEKTGLKPLDAMSADDRYLEQDGGLYGHGRNEPPEEHRKAAERELSRIRPLDGEGRPAADGRIVLVSISMSNATQEFSRFKQLADAAPEKSPQLTIVDCAQGGQAMAEWVRPDARPWAEAFRRLERAGVTPEQVQVAWIKLANKGPRGDLENHGRKLQRDTTRVIQNAREKFPNLRIAYLSSRIYGGYSGGPLNPEPFAYESAFVVRWLIQDQIAGKPELLHVAPAGADTAVRAPLLLWGPYLWADGVTPRGSDGLVWKREDLGADGTHPSRSGRDKVARMLLSFFQDNPLARSWFVGSGE